MFLFIIPSDTGPWILKIRYRWSKLFGFKNILHLTLTNWAASALAYSFPASFWITRSNLTHDRNVSMNIRWIWIFSKTAEPSNRVDNLKSIIDMSGALFWLKVIVAAFFPKIWEFYLPFLLCSWPAKASFHITHVIRSFHSTLNKFQRFKFLKLYEIFNVFHFYFLVASYNQPQIFFLVSSTTDRISFFLWCAKILFILTSERYFYTLILYGVATICSFVNKFDCTLTPFDLKNTKTIDETKNIPVLN